MTCGENVWTWLISSKLILRSFRLDSQAIEREALAEMPICFGYDRATLSSRAEASGLNPANSKAQSARDFSVRFCGFSGPDSPLWRSIITHGRPAEQIAAVLLSN